MKMPSLYTLWMKRRELYEAVFRIKRTSCQRGRKIKGYHSFLDLSHVGLGPYFHIGVFIVVGQVVKDVAGPSAILSILIAAIASILSDLCNAELKSRWPKDTESFYDFHYLSLGEMAGFMTAWSTLLQKITCAAAIARAISQNLDCMIGNKIRNETILHIGTIDIFHSNPDFIGGLIAVLLTLIAALGVKCPRWPTIIINILTPFLALFVAVVGLYHVNFHFWSESENYFQYGVQGVFMGAAIYTYLLSCSGNAILMNSDVTIRTNRRPIILALITTFGVSTLLWLAMSSITSLIGSTLALLSETPVAEVFELSNLPWIKYVFCIGAVLCLFCFSAEILQSLGNLCEDVSNDGLLFVIFSHVNTRTGTTLFSYIVLGVMVCLCTILFNLTDLIQLSTMGALIVSINTALASLVFHYNPTTTSPLFEVRSNLKKPRRSHHSHGSRGGAHTNDGYGSTTAGSQGPLSVSSDPLSCSSSIVTLDEVSNSDTRRESRELHGQIQQADCHDSSDTDIDDAVEEYKDKIRVSLRSDDTYRKVPTEFTAKLATVACIGFILCIMISSTLAIHGSYLLQNHSIFPIVVLCFFLTIAVMCAAVLYKQPVDPIAGFDLTFKLSFVPTVPLITIFLHVILIQSLPALPWVQTILWFITGLILYFAYGIKHSKEILSYNLVPNETHGLLPESSIEDNGSERRDSSILDPDDDLLIE